MSKRPELRRSAGRVMATVGLAVLAGALLLPEAAPAHGIVGKTDLPIPRWLFAWAAAVVLVVSFVALATLWPTPRLEQARERLVGRFPRILDPLSGAIGLALFVVVVYAGFAGRPQATSNIAPTFVFVIFWVGLAVLSLFTGDIFRALNPWRALARGTAWIAGRISRTGLPAPMPYPPRWGRWPAVVMIAAYAWLELVYANKDDPSTLSALALAYAAIQLIGMSVYGIETWSTRADGFGVYFGLFARLAPWRWAEGCLYRRAPVVGAATLDPLPGTAALLAVMIGSTSFDGFSVGSAWTSLEPHVQSVFSDLGAGREAALELAYTVGLVGMIVVVGGLFALGVAGMRSVGGGHRASELAARFAHSLVPIALAYVVAHYFSLLVFQGQAMGYLISDPLGDGSNIFGTGGWQIDYNAVASNAVWYVQVGALVLGHVAGLLLAHDRALVVYRRASQATRSQYWMLAVMVGFTSLGLWILSSTT